MAVSPIYVSCAAYALNPNLPHVFTLTMQGGFAATDTIQWYFNGTAVSAALGGNSPIIDFKQPALGFGLYCCVK